MWRDYRSAVKNKKTKIKEGVHSAISHRLKELTPLFCGKCAVVNCAPHLPPSEDNLTGVFLLLCSKTCKTLQGFSEFHTCHVCVPALVAAPGTRQ